HRALHGPSARERGRLCVLQRVLAPGRTDLEAAADPWHGRRQRAVHQLHPANERAAAARAAVRADDLSGRAPWAAEEGCTAPLPDQRGLLRALPAAVARGGAAGRRRNPGGAGMPGPAPGTAPGFPVRTAVASIGARRLRLPPPL